MESASAFWSWKVAWRTGPSAITGLLAEPAVLFHGPLEQTS